MKITSYEVACGITQQQHIESEWVFIVNVLKMLVTVKIENISESLGWMFLCFKKGLTLQKTYTFDQK